jgi:fused signal recognition particle receptor
MFGNFRKKLKKAFLKSTEENYEDKKEDLNIEKKKKFFPKLKLNVSQKEITKDVFDNIWAELELFLLEINVAFEISQKIGEELKKKIIGKSFSRFSLFEKIKEVMIEETIKVLKIREKNFLDVIKKIKEKNGIVKIIFLGVNGTGKTTTIAKIINLIKNNNFSCVVSASDTFRAAGIDQLEEHCKKLNTKIIKHKFGSDPGAVAYDSIEHAKAKKIDIVLIDTAGRMPNNKNLMEELKKIKKVSDSDLNIFIGDSNSNNDLIEQINLFNKIVEIDGIILTKVDTDEKPGSIISASYIIEKPIFFLGTGQNYEDLIEFNATKISSKLFDN